jgi:uncharacterized membrane protein
MEEQKHSGLGVASFITSLVSGILLFLLIVIAGVIEASTPGGMDEKSAAAVIVGLFMIFFLGASLVALGLGIGGLIQKDRKKIFAILGTVFAAITFLGTILLMMVGLATG